jgi:O-glycosyl hydrolase
MPSKLVARWLQALRPALAWAPRPRLAPPRLEQLEDRCLPSTLTIDGSQHFQAIDGFGTNLSSEAWNGGAVTPSLDTLLAHGYQLFRVIVEPVQGWEDTNPNTGAFSASNPNWGYYNNLYGTSTKFTDLWNTIRYLNDHGATVWLNLQSDAPAWMTDSGGAPGSVGPDHEADWATMVSTMVDYAMNTAHVRIDALGPMNEPDLPDDPTQGPQVGAAQYVRMLDTLETQLQGYGLGTIPLVGPDTTSPVNAVNSYVPAMLADPFLMPHVFQFGFHTYGGGVSDSAITSNSTYPGRHLVSDEYDGPYYNEDHGQRATPAQLWTQADASFQNLIAIVDAGENGAVIWDGVDNFYEYYQQWSAHGLISYDWTAADPTAQVDYGTTTRLYANAMMFQFVGPGSVRIGSSDDADNFIEEAFQDPTTGRVTVVGENTGTSSQTISGNLTGGLNASLFRLYYTNSSLNEQRQADVAVTGNAFTFSVPADTIFTLTTRAAPAVTGVTPISGLTTGGQTVTITGSGFTGATDVFFGSSAAVFTVVSDTQLTATAPAHAVGIIDVTVRNPVGTSATSAADRFTFVPPLDRMNSPVNFALTVDGTLWQHDLAFDPTLPPDALDAHWRQLSVGSFASFSAVTDPSSGRSVVFALARSDHSLWVHDLTFDPALLPDALDAHWRELSSGGFASLSAAYDTSGANPGPVVFGLLQGGGLWEHNLNFDPSAPADATNVHWRLLSSGAFDSISAASDFTGISAGAPAVFGIAQGSGQLFEHDLNFDPSAPADAPNVHWRMISSAAFDSISAPNNAAGANLRPVVFGVLKADHSLWQHDLSFDATQLADALNGHWRKLSSGAFASVSATIDQANGNPVLLAILQGDRSVWVHDLTFDAAASAAQIDAHWRELSSGAFASVSAGYEHSATYTGPVVSGTLLDEELWLHTLTFDPSLPPDALNAHWRRLSSRAITANAMA